MRIRVHTTSRWRIRSTILGDSRCKIRSDDASMDVPRRYRFLIRRRIRERRSIDRLIVMVYSRQSSVNAHLSVSSNVPVEIPGSATRIFAHFKRAVVARSNNFTWSFFHTVRIVNHDFSSFTTDGFICSTKNTKWYRVKCCTQFTIELTNEP